MEQWLQNFLFSLTSGPSYYTLIALITLGEGLVVIGLFIPGSALSISVGALAYHGHGSLPFACLAAACGAILGDFCSYLIGSRGGSALIKNHLPQRYLPLLRRSELFFAAHGGKSLLFSRFLGPIRGFTPFVAGALFMPFRQFVAYTVSSGLLWAIAYPGLGYLGGMGWQQHQQWLNHTMLSAGILLIVALFCVWFFYWRRR